MAISVGDFKTTYRMRQLVNQALDNDWLSYGPFSHQFEQRFAELHGCKYGILSNSGTSSLLVALQTLKELHGWQDGDEVIVPALTFVATVNIILQNNLKPVLVDIDDFCTINCDIIERAITPKTRAILPVHLFGQPCDMKAIEEVANQYNLKIVEDSCEAAFATYLDKSISSWGDIGCHSFYMAHIITCGVGGIALTNNPDYARKIRSLTNHGLAYDQLSNVGKFDPTMLSRNFVFDSVGHSARITEMESALGLAQLDNWQGVKRARQINHQYLIDTLTDLHNDGFIQLPNVRPGVSYTPMMFPILTLTESKSRLMQYLTSKGVGVRDALPLTNQPVYRYLFDEDNYPKAKEINERGFYIACHQYLKRQDLDYMVENIARYYGPHNDT